jgi:hypothetical protein
MGAAASMLQDLSRGRLHGIVNELLDGGSPDLDILPIWITSKTALLCLQL